MLNTIENKHRLLMNYLKLAVPILAVMLVLGIVIIFIFAATRYIYLYIKYL